MFALNIFLGLVDIVIELMTLHIHMLMGYAELVEQKEGGKDQDKYICKVRDLFIEKYIQYSKLEIGKVFIGISALKGFYWQYNTSK